MSELRKKIIDACETLNISKISAVLEEGVDINETSKYGESILSAVCSNIYNYDKDGKRYEVVKFLLDNGADPNILEEDGIEKLGPLDSAMWAMDAEMIELLCSYGADPNAVWGLSEQESFYDFAVSEYYHEYANYNFPDNPTYEDGKTLYPMAFPEEPTAEDEKDEDSRLNFMQRMAEKYSFKEPTHLFVLRKYGAKGWRELQGAG
ncbi:MAG: ankyrin repeat domain-containing protein [Candidatus Nitrohelix vancouverensis]|uniref:Ankyrin repeat domain-containing protein n=1 Tax=Candidatus Nitrohelix vancouverensis TaxID=2705534 RepID=A0A7T0G2X8_9BACT|nr:MAG: ankyrin repeat domain-containing protein [Candidatus Nitrohelix vancouverensis]